MLLCRAVFSPRPHGRKKLGMFQAPKTKIATPVVIRVKEGEVQLRCRAAGVYWAAVVVLREEGAVELGAMRRGATSPTQRAAGDWGRGALRGQFQLLKLKESALYDRDGAGELAPWRHKKERADAQSGLRAGDLPAAEGPINWIPIAGIVIVIARQRSTQPVTLPTGAGKIAAV